MICPHCSTDSSENNFECSHNVPVYLFEGLKRNERKEQADKMGRTNLCLDCHYKYEGKVLQLLCLNLLKRKIIYIENRKERMPYFREIKSLGQKKKDIGIKICLKLNEVKG